MSTRDGPVDEEVSQEQVTGVEGRTVGVDREEVRCRGLRGWGSECRDIETQLVGQRGWRLQAPSAALHSLH